MAETEIRPIAILEDALEASLLSQVLQEEGIPFRIEVKSHRLHNILGRFENDRRPSPFDNYPGYARVWGAASDAERILACLQDVRESQVVIEEKPYLVNGRMWRIKKQ